MTIARGIAAVGRLMIRSGILILLFVVYQLWGTGIHTSRAQQDLGRQFKAQQQQVAGATTTTNASTDTTATATTATLAPRPAASLPAPAPGQPIGQIYIPRIGADFYMVEGTDLRWLEEGPGHFPGTPLPGQAGNAAIAGHRTTYKAPFNRIDELNPGDKITITTLQGTFTYQVMPQVGSDPSAPPSGHRIVSPSAVEILDNKGDNRLTLMACHPKYSAAQRIVVEAALVGNPAPPTPRTSTATNVSQADLAGVGGAGLAGGDPSARPAAAGFLLLALGVWALAWYVARRVVGWWRIAPYIVLSPAAAVTLYLAFENITRLLPASY